MADRMTQRLRRHLKLALFSLSDLLCAHRWSFEIGHQVGELGWRLRQPGAVKLPQEDGGDG